MDTRQEFVPVTLVIPAFNRRSLLNATLDSALAQILPFAEVVVVDDGSSDGTAEWLAEAYPQVRVHRQANAGVQVARNVGIDLARTEWVALLDSDDLLEPDYVAEVSALAARYPELDAIFCNFVTFQDAMCSPDKLSSAPFNFLAGAKFDGDLAFDIPNLYSRSVSYQPLFTCGLLINRRFVQQHGGYAAAFRGVGAEDWEFTLRLISEGRVALCRRVLARVRKHESNDSLDNLHMRLGEVQILEYGLRRHSEAPKHRMAIVRSVRDRLESAFGTAFDRADFVKAKEVFRRVEGPWTIKLLVKVAICYLPTSMAMAVWRRIQ